MQSTQFQVNGLRIGPSAILCGALAAGALALLQPTSSLAQEVEEKTQAERIEALEKKLEALEGQVDDSHKGMTTDQLEKWYEGIAATQPANYSADYHKGKAQRFVADEGWLGVKGKPLEFQIAGWVQAAVFHDFQGNAIPYAQEFSSGAILVPTQKPKTTGFDAASSRLFIQMRHVFKGEQKRKNYPGVTHVFFEMDLGGDQLPGGLGPRVRQLWVQHGHLTFGQANGTFANGGTWPSYMDRGAPGAYPLARKPVIRYAAALSKGEKDATHVLTPAIEQASASFTNANSGSNSPDIVLRYDYNPDWGNLMGAAIVRYHVAESTVTPGQRATAWVAAGTLSGWATIPTKNKDHLKWNVVVGPGISGYMWDTGIAGGLDANYIDATNTLETMMAWGIWAAWERPWAEKWSSLFMLSYADIVNIASQAADTFNNSVTATVTLDYEPWTNLFVATEYFYGRRANFDGQNGQDHRLNLVLRYMMNR